MLFDAKELRLFTLEEESGLFAPDVGRVRLEIGRLRPELGRTRLDVGLNPLKRKADPGRFEFSPDAKFVSKTKAILTQR